MVKKVFISSASSKQGEQSVTKTKFLQRRNFVDFHLLIYGARKQNNISSPGPPYTNVPNGIVVQQEYFLKKQPNPKL